MEDENDFFVTGRVIDYLNYKSYLDNKDTCTSSVENKRSYDNTGFYSGASSSNKEISRGGLERDGAGY